VTFCAQAGKPLLNQLVRVFVESNTTTVCVCVVSGLVCLSTAEGDWGQVLCCVCVCLCVFVC
jgi:hypothetical protein